MKSRLFTILLGLLSIVTYGQDAQQLNKESKEYLMKKDFKSAFPLLQRAAEMGVPEAQYNLGLCYQEGIQTEKNDSIANHWYLKSAEQGWTDSQFKISFSYATGRGIEVNAERTFYWTHKCAEKNDYDCIFNLITCYKDGFGTSKDMDKVIEWAVILAKQENPEDLSKSGKITSARLNLATMYWDGQEIKRDLVESYKWFLLYNEGKRDFSFFQQQKVVEQIKKLEKLLTEEEKTIALELAEKTMGRKLNNHQNLYKTEH